MVQGRWIAAIVFVVVIPPVVFVVVRRMDASPVRPLSPVAYVIILAIIVVTTLLWTYWIQAHRVQTAILRGRLAPNVHLPNRSSQG